MYINFNEYGFRWPNATIVENHSGSQMKITPANISGGYQTALNDRLKEHYRMYTTPLGLKSELDIKHWQAGLKIEMVLLDAFIEIFKKSGESEMLRSAVSKMLKESGFKIIQIDIVVDWLIKGQFVNYDPKTTMLSAIKPKRGNTILT